jgi:hypothetical protein
MAPPRKEFRLGHGTAKVNAERAAKRADSGSAPPRVEGFTYGVPQPKPDSRWHPNAQAWYRSLALTDVSSVYQPADWMLAYVAAEVLDRLYTYGFSAGLVKEWAAMADRLHAPRIDLLGADATPEAEPVDPDEEAAEAAILDIRRNLKAVD